MNKTSFVEIYDSFLSKVTDDMYMQLNELDTYRLLQELLLSALEYFEFPRFDITDYNISEVDEISEYQGVDSNNEKVEAVIYSGGTFNMYLTHEEVNIIATYMVEEWIGQQLATVELVRQQYAGNDFKMTSQANHLSKLTTLKKQYITEGFHLQRLYKRRKKDKNGIQKSTFGQIMQPIDE